MSPEICESLGERQALWTGSERHAAGLLDEECTNHLPKKGDRNAGLW
jgi:hypothetical protein